MVVKTSGEFTVEEWVGLLTERRGPARERVVSTGPFGRAFRIEKDAWKTHFADFA